MSALHDFLSVQVSNEKLIREQLRASASEIDKLMKKSLASPRTSAANVRLAQYSIVRSEIRAVLREMWNDELSPLIAEGMSDAAGEAGAMDILNGLISEEMGISQRTWENSMRQTAKNNYHAYMARVQGDSYQPLSSRVYRNAELSNGAVDRVVNNALLTGKSARELAREVRGLIAPDVPGGISYSALRLGRTELNNAFHATTIVQHGNNPWVKGLLWQLSGSHTRSDACDDYAGKVYSAAECPAKPHPQCFCFITPETVSDDEFVRKYARGDYDTAIDDMLSSGG